MTNIIDASADQQAKWSKQFAAFDPGRNDYPDLVEEALKLIGAAREAGAVLGPWHDMPYGQRQFWLQRATGLEHKFG